MRAVGEVLLCSGVPTQITLGAFVRILWPGSMPDDGQLSGPVLVTLLLADTVVLIVLMIWLMRARSERPSEIWLGPRPWLREALFGLALLPAIVVLVLLILNTIRLTAPWLHNVPVNPLEQIAGRSTADAVLLGIAAIAAGGVREELQRAFLLHRFETHLGGATVGVIVLSVGFGLGHYVQGWDAAITTAAMGAVWAVVYVRRRSAIAPVVSHAAFNSLEMLRVVLAP